MFERAKNYYFREKPLTPELSTWRHPSLSCRLSSDSIHWCHKNLILSWRQVPLWKAAIEDSTRKYAGRNVEHRVHFGEFLTFIFRRHKLFSSVFLANFLAFLARFCLVHCWRWVGTARGALPGVPQCASAPVPPPGVRSQSVVCVCPCLSLLPQDAIHPRYL